MTTPYTPGPWKFGRWEQFGDTRFYISQAEGAPYTPHYSDVATLIAETVSSERVAIQEANALVIAAAPEMHELLETLREWVRQVAAREDVPLGVRNAAAMLHDDCKRVCAKATGEPA